jgi:hypothetical protein
MTQASSESRKIDQILDEIDAVLKEAGAGTRE